LRGSIVPAQSEHIEEWDDECFMGGVLQYMPEFARFRCMEPADADNCATLAEISHILGGVAAKVLWTVAIRAVTFLTTPL
jgi:hypothetical protein